MGKIVIFAHTPPPHHGQSAMVQVLVDACESAARTDSSFPGYYHVNSRWSEDIDDVGRAGARKLVSTFRYVFRAVCHRVLGGADVLYYVPAPAKRNPLLRDWIVLLCCRLFFRKVILHWHAAGLGQWVAGSRSSPAAIVTLAVFRRHLMSITLNESNRDEVKVFRPRRIEIVPNGIEDPCAEIVEVVAARERRRRAGSSESTDLLFVGLCSEEKGLFEAVDVVRHLNGGAADGSGLPAFRLHVVGKFPDREAEERFWNTGATDRRQRVDGADKVMGSDVVYHGFLSGEEKSALYRSADAMLFLTRYRAENQPLVIIEAMAYGLPVVTTAWRGIVEMLPEGYPGIVGEASGAAAIAEILRRDELYLSGPLLRERFEERFTRARHVDRMMDLIGGLCREAP